MATTKLLQTEQQQKSSREKASGPNRSTKKSRSERESSGGGHIVPSILNSPGHHNNWSSLAVSLKLSFVKARWSWCCCGGPRHSLCSGWSPTMMTIMIFEGNFKVLRKRPTSNKFQENGRTFTSTLIGSGMYHLVTLKVPPPFAHWKESLKPAGGSQALRHIFELFR